MDKETLIAREKEKYNTLHSTEIGYGGRSGRAKAFLRNKDAFHCRVKQALKGSKTLLDVGCGKGFFSDFFRIHYKLDVTGIDIADEVAKFRPDLKIIICDASKMPFPDNHFDVVAHMDGMEHIPRELENEVLQEELRVAKKYIYHTVALHKVHRDQEWINKGFGAVHINMRTAEEWRGVFLEYCEKNKIKMLGFEDYKDWAHVLMEK